MMNTPVNASQTRPLPEREAIREELEATRANFRRLLNSVSTEQWRQKSPSSEWSVGEIFFHLVWAIEYLPKEIARARQNKGMFNMPKWFADPMSYWYIRLSARKIIPAQLGQRYDRAIDATLQELEKVQDSEWERGAKFYGEGFYSVEDLFYTPAKHLAEHTVGL